MNGLYASDGEINLEKNDNLISNDYAVKLCLEYEVRKGKKLVKKELMVLLRGEIYFGQFIINPEVDEFEPGLLTEIDLPPMVCKCGMGDCKMDEKKGNWKSEGQLDLLWTTLRELIDSEDRLILEILVDDILRVAA
ncbi:hypothetical protein Tco_1266457 [Tanacetum coccineum]